SDPPIVGRPRRSLRKHFFPILVCRLGLAPVCRVESPPIHNLCRAQPDRLHSSRGSARVSDLAFDYTALDHDARSPLCFFVVSRGIQMAVLRHVLFVSLTKTVLVSAQILLPFT